MKLLLIAAGCALTLAGWQPQRTDMDNIAENYVKLVLAVGQHDPDYVDAYYGPADWKPDEAYKPPLDTLTTRAAGLRDAIGRQPQPTGELERLRVDYLDRQLAAMSARLRMLKGERLSFD